MRRRSRWTAALVLLALVAGCDPLDGPTTIAASGQPVSSTPSASAATSPSAKANAKAKPSASSSASASSSTVPLGEDRCGNASSKVLLTFDDGGSDEHIRKIMAVLKKHRVGALMLPTGKPAKVSQTGPDKPIIQEMRDQGFWVGNHSWSHPINPPLAKMTDDKIAAQIRDGISGSHYFRPPGGSVGPNVRRIAAAQGYRLCLWTVDTLDWKDGRTGAQVLAAALTAQPGGVVLMHLHDDAPTLPVLERIILGLKGTARKPGPGLCKPYDGPTPIEIPYPLPC